MILDYMQIEFLVLEQSFNSKFKLNDETNSLKLKT